MHFRYELTQSLNSIHTLLYINKLLCAGNVSVFTVLRSHLCIFVRVSVWSLLPPGLAAQHAHAGNVDAYEPPCHQVFEGSQRTHKSV